MEDKRIKCPGCGETIIPEIIGYNDPNGDWNYDHRACPITDCQRVLNSDDLKKTI